MTAKKLIELLNKLDDKEKELIVCIDDSEEKNSAVEAEYLGVINDEDGDCVCFKSA
jgi:hypothetical protein